MTPIAPAARVGPVCRIAEWHWCAWLSVNLLLYVALEFGALTGYTALDPVNRTGVMALAVPMTALIALVWTWPYQLLLLPLVAGVLAVVRAFRHLPRYAFRLLAVGAFAGPALALTWWLTGGDPAALSVVTAMHVLMGLLVIRPRDPDIWR